MRVLIHGRDILTRCRRSSAPTALSVGSCRAACSAYTDRIRQVSRSPRRVNATDELFSADLLDAKATADAVAGSDVSYLAVGLKYDHRVWQQQWPRVMRNAIDACKRHHSALVFFDNVYAYGRVDGVMTEETPYNPCSRKGEVRARIATMFMDEVRRGELRGMIVRSADFYGPGAIQTLTHMAVTARLKAGKTPQWIGNPRAVHTFTYTPDAGRTVALLGNTDGAYGQVWHALTSKTPMTGEAVRANRVRAVGTTLSRCKWPRAGCCRSWASSFRCSARTWRCSTSSSTTTASTAPRWSGRSPSRRRSIGRALPTRWPTPFRVNSSPRCRFVRHVR